MAKSKKAKLGKQKAANKRKQQTEANQKKAKRGR